MGGAGDAGPRPATAAAPRGLGGVQPLAPHRADPAARRVRAPRRPLVAAALAALAGAWLGTHLGAPFPAALRVAAGLAIPVGLAALLLGSGATPRGPASLRRLPRGVGTAAALLLILAATGLRAAAGPPPGVAAHPTTGRYWPEGRFAGTERGRIDGPGLRVRLPVGLARAGEWVRVEAPLDPPPAARGPVRRGDPPPPVLEVAPDEWVRLGPPPADPLGRARIRWIELRARAQARIEGGMQDPRTGGLAAAMLLGERAGLDPELADLFTRTGTRHLLAISGLHVGLVALLVATPLGCLLAGLARRLGRGPGWARTPGPWIAGFMAPLVPLSGAGAPVTRAFVALALYAVTRALPPTRGGQVRRADPLSLLALAAVLEVSARPTAAVGASLQLSYAATLGLILAVGPIASALGRGLPGAGRLPTVTGLGRPVPAWIRVPAQRALDAARLALAVSLAASLATLPVLWSGFGEVGLAGVIATPLALPFLAAFLAGGWLWLCLPSAPLEALLGLAAQGLTGLLELADRLPGTPLVLPPRPPGLLLAATAGALAVAAGRAPRPLSRATAILWGGLLLPWRPAPAGLELYLLDVGHGTSAVLRAPGAPTLVFDAGSRDRHGVARLALAPLLADLETREAVYALSHPDRDHSAALPWVLDRFPARLWLGALTQDIEARLPRGVPRLDPGVGRFELALGSRGELPLRIELLRGRTGEDNQGSRSLLVEWGGQRLLLSGDADGEGLARKLREGWLSGPLRLVLVPHHGSESGQLFPLLEQSRPEELWISAGGGTPVEAELARRGLPWRSTAREGPLILRLGPRSPPAPAARR